MRATQIRAHVLYTTRGVPPFIDETPSIDFCTYSSILLLADVEKNPRIGGKIHGWGGPIGYITYLWSYYSLTYGEYSTLFCTLYSNMVFDVLCF